MALRLLALSLILFMTGFAARPTQDQPISEVFSPSKLAKVKSLYKERCTRCHGADGSGQTVLGEFLNPPNFKEEKWSKSEINNDDLISTISRGKGEMPAFGKKLTRQEIAALVLYIREFSKKKRNGDQ